MKRALQFIALLAVITLTVACKKEKSNAEKIIGKWNYNKLISKMTHLVSGNTMIDTITSHTGNYINFTKEGDIYAHYWDEINNEYDDASGTFKVIDSKVIFTYINAGVSVSDTSSIEKLNETELILFNSYIRNDIDLKFEDYSYYSR